MYKTNENGFMSRKLEQFLICIKCIIESAMNAICFIINDNT